MLRKIILSFILLISFKFTMYSQFQLKGFVEYDNITYFKEIANSFNGRNQGILQLNLEHRLNDHVDIFSSVEFRVDENNNLRNRVYLDEAYINFRQKKFDLRIGKQIYKWGKSDAINPTNYFSNTDYSDIIDTEDEEIGVISLNLKYYIGNVVIEGVIAPSFIPSVLPDSSARWWPTLPKNVSNPLYPAVGWQLLETNYFFPAPTIPQFGTQSFQYSVKLSGFMRGLDYSLSWFNGFNDLPDLYFVNEIDTMTFSSVNISSIYSYNRINALGVNLAFNAGKFSVRGEAAYFITEDWDGEKELIDDPYLQYVIGVDRIFFGDKLFVLAQWIQELQVPDRNTTYSVYDLKHIFQKSVLGRVEYKLNDSFKFSVQGIYNIDNEDFWIQPAINWIIYDGIEFNLIYDHVEGSENSFFGLYKDNKRIQVKLKYNFSNK